MTKLPEENEEPTITVGGETYPISGLSDQVKELLSLHQEANQMAMSANRQAAIHDLAAKGIADLIEKAVIKTEG